MAIDYYHVDVFVALEPAAGRPAEIAGNPAGVCLLDQWPDDASLQGMASELSLPATTFLVAAGAANYDVRWFAPNTEIRLCGHGSLAGGFVATELRGASSPVRLRSPAHEVLVSTGGPGQMTMNLPSWPIERQLAVDGPEARAVGGTPVEVVASSDHVVLRYRTADEVRALSPDEGALRSLQIFPLPTAPTNDPFDCVTRVFPAAAGAPEDPATGSAQCTLAPYWADRLGRRQLRTWQVSARGGSISANVEQDHVEVTGACRLFARGQIL